MEPLSVWNTRERFCARHALGEERGWEGEREGGREGRRERGREGERKGERKGEREGGREEGWKRGREGEREGGREGAGGEEEGQKEDSLLRYILFHLCACTHPHTHTHTSLSLFFLRGHKRAIVASLSLFSQIKLIYTKQYKDQDTLATIRKDDYMLFGLVASPFFLFIEKSFHVITQLGV